VGDLPHPSRPRTAKRRVAAPAASPREALLLPGKKSPLVRSILTDFYRLRDRVARASSRSSDRVARTARPTAQRGKSPGAKTPPPARTRTLLACSGGADSSALLLALAAIADAGDTLIVAHIVHDLRPAAEALRDRDAVAKLVTAVNAARLATSGNRNSPATEPTSKPRPIRFVQARVKVRALPGNAEANARIARYNALITLARKHGCTAIATGHTQTDQAETLLMRLLRGSGLRGLSAMADCRRLSPIGDKAPPIHLIRPLLQLSASETRSLCREAGCSWSDDATNLDTTRLRAAIRHTVLPQLEALAPGSTARLAATTATLRQADRAIRSAAARWIRTGPCWSRTSLAALPQAVLAEVLMTTARTLTRRIGADQLRRGTVEAACTAIRSGVSGRKNFLLGGATVQVSGSTVHITAPAARAKPAKD
jgi:tRNA(Ile)-lysidine synthase